ncbi:MAG: NAD-dependent epimerase/dehydratase family protein [Bacteroidetes bacterium]|nr:MAG: NAD-dependent epimerase/dehydratase family protein [Bacteroidota bacterium]
MPTWFVTGFPGFLGSALVGRLLDRAGAGTTLTCLVQPRFRDVAVARVAALEAAWPAARGRLRLVEGDITRPDLGLGASGYAALQAGVEAIYHLAAVYDLGVRREVGMRVNVDGTRHVLQLADGCSALRRLHYVSTCYVSGRYDGVFTEDDLDVGQRFNNHYEETKYLAEVAVQEAMRQGLPATVYRPAIVVGDSRTGATQKYDGPYYLIRWVLRWRRVAPMPLFGDPHRVEVNLVPSDYVIDALAYLSAQSETAGRVYHLSDPRPETVDGVLRLIEQTTGRRLLRLRLPPGPSLALMTHVPRLARWTGIEPQALPYFSHPTRYTCANTLRDLDGSGIACPALADYLPMLVAYVQAHPDVPATAMY